MIRINMGEETCQRYDAIKTSSALVEKIKENKTKIMKKDTESIETGLSTLPVEYCGSVLSYYNEM